LNVAILAGTSLALLVAVGALVREMRLRRALQVLLHRLLSYWRMRAYGKNPDNHTDNQPDRDVDRL
jgi:hypothetical protein